MLRVLAILCAVMLIPMVAGGNLGDLPDDLERWIAVDPPEKGSEGWFAANDDVGHEWVVSLRDRHAHAQLRNHAVDRDTSLPFEIERSSARDGLAGRRLAVKVADGWIVAFNAGEFGAGLWWFSPDGKKRYKISESWVSGFLETEVGLLALEGLAHGGQSRGRIIRLSRDREGRWQSADFVDLGHAPEAAAKRADGSLLVATTDRLLKVVPSEKKVEVLCNDVFWGGLYPNSLVIAADGTAYLGMRHGVAKIQAKGGKWQVTWLLPNQDFVNMKSAKGFK